MTAYAIGLDIGIASVGWAAVGLDKDEKPYTILGMGSRIFPVAEETDKQKPPSLAANRRVKRGTRRRLRRQRHRNERIRELMLRSGLVTDEELDHLFEGHLSDVYALRVDALDRPLTNTEFARILIHISQRRGFRSNRKGGTNEKDGLMLTATKANAERMAAAGYRTVAEMLLKDETFKERKRNKGGGYLTTVTRAMIEDEVDRIFEAQRKFGNENASEEFQTAYKEILLSQRSYAFGPGGNSPYGGNLVEKMRGKCTFFPEEPRAAKATYSFQYFELLQKINHIRLTEIGEKEGKPLSDNERQQLVQLAKQVKNLTYAGIRKKLGIPKSKAFNGIRYDKEDAEKNEKFKCMKSWHEIRTVLEKVGLNINDLSVAQLDAIGEAFSINDTSENIRAKLEQAGVPDNVIETLDTAGINFSKFGHLSRKALKMIIPGLEQGLTYNDACDAAGFNHRGHDKKERTDTLHLTPEDYENITSPVVKRAVSQTIKVLNAIIRKQGCPPTYVKIELQRDMAKTREERADLEKENKENQAENERLYTQIRDDYGVRYPSGQDIIKLKLYRQQGGVSAYSPETPITSSQLFDHSVVEIDHIIPYSRSFDDRMSNKVLVFRTENRDKGNRLPLEYLSGSRLEKFKVWAEKQPRAKKANLLCETYTKEDENGFIERNLQDTKHMSRFLMNYIKDNLKFAPIVEKNGEEKKAKEKRRVMAVNGSVTAYLRKRWGFSKNRADGDLHHAVDALVIVCTTQKMINELSAYFKWHETRYRTTESGRIVDKRTGEIKFDIPVPWPHFREDAECFKQTCFVSRMPNHKVTGSAHEDTIRSAKGTEDGLLIKHVALEKLELDKNGEIKGYYRPDLDPALYEALKARLVEFGGKGIKAFAEPFYKPDNPGRIVRRVRLVETKGQLENEIRGGWAANDNGSMVRVDVFRKDGKYWMVPIYVRDTVKPNLPNKAVTRGKPYSEWVEMDEKDFIFSLYPNDLIFVRNEKGITLTKPGSKDSKTEKEFILYYKAMGVASCSIACINHDNSYEKQSLGFSTVDCLEKYTVDVLGEYHKVEKEKRQRFNRKED